MNDLALRHEKVLRLEREVEKLPQIAIPIAHFFAHGVYARQMTMPAGTVLTGRIHGQSQINICSQGDVSVMTDEGLRRVQAPFTMTAPKGAKRAFYAHTETVWTTILGTHESDPDTIEDTLTFRSFDDYLLGAP